MSHSGRRRRHRLSRPSPLGPGFPAEARPDAGYRSFCNLAQIAGNCGNPIEVLVPSRALRTPGEVLAKGPRQIRFGASVTNVPPGTIGSVPLTLPKADQELHTQNREENHPRPDADQERGWDRHRDETDKNQAEVTGLANSTPIPHPLVPLIEARIDVSLLVVVYRSVPDRADRDGPARHPSPGLNSHLTRLASIAARTQDPAEKHEAEQLLRAIVQHMPEARKNNATIPMSKTMAIRDPTAQESFEAADIVSLVGRRRLELPPAVRPGGMVFLLPLEERTQLVHRRRGRSIFWRCTAMSIGLPWSVS